MLTDYLRGLSPEPAHGFVTVPSRGQLMFRIDGPSSPLNQGNVVAIVFYE